jgi:tetratricopeptide (TPR) repeat protein
MLKAVAKMRELQQQGNLQKAIDVYERLSSSQQREKLALVTYTTIAAELGNDEYLAAINLCAREFPHDPGTLIFLLDKYALMERHQDVIATIERIDSLVDGDPYLDYLRGLHYVMLDDLQSARTAFNDAIYAEPMLEEAYIPMVDVLIRMEDYKQAVVYLNGLTHRFEKSWEDIDSYYQSAATAEPHYAEFVKSDAYELLRDQTLRREHRAHDS